MSDWNSHTLRGRARVVDREKGCREPKTELRSLISNSSSLKCAVFSNHAMRVRVIVRVRKNARLFLLQPKLFQHLKQQTFIISHDSMRQLGGSSG